jgi:hypothetical protein
MKIDKKCLQCGKRFAVYPSQDKSFCSTKCYGLSIKGDSHPRWNGGVIDVKGYLYEFRPAHPRATNRGYVLQHRLVMEMRLGRFLRDHEVVHHINGDTKDNRRENLVVCKSPGKHSAEHHTSRDAKGRFAKD